MNTKRAVQILLISIEDETGDIEKVSKLIHLASELSSSCWQLGHDSGWVLVSVENAVIVEG